jgi:hypothetical protein
MVQGARSEVRETVVPIHSGACPGLWDAGWTSPSQPYGRG